MKVVVARPPLFDLISVRFNVAGRAVFYAWGDTIYNPGGVTIPPELMAHEAVHGRRQGSDVEGWWRRYIDDPKFRLAEEIPAHVEEYRLICQTGGRHERRAGLVNVARRLSSPLYGRLISLDEAKRVIRDGASR